MPKKIAERASSWAVVLNGQSGESFVSGNWISDQLADEWLRQMYTLGLITSGVVLPIVRPDDAEIELRRQANRLTGDQ